MAASPSPYARLLTADAPFPEEGFASAAPEFSRAFECLARVVDLLARTTDRKALLEGTLDAALEPLGLTMGAIYMRPPGASHISLEAERGIPAQFISRRGRQPIGDTDTGISGASAHRQGALVIQDLSREPIARELVAAFKEAGITVTSAAAVPVVIEGRSAGVLFVLSDAHRVFSPVELSYLRLAGTLLGVALLRNEATQELGATAEQLRALTAALEHRKDDLKELDKFKTRAIHLITHELRKPLTPIFTYADMMLDMDFPPEKRRQFLTQIRASAEEMNQYVAEMIETSKLEEGGIQLLYADVDVSEIVRGAVARFGEAAREANVTVQIVDDLKMSRFTTDGEKIGQILDNLIENGIKYTPSGGRVVVRLALEGDALAISIRDSGIGIPPEDLLNLFSKFYIVKRAAVPRPTHRAGLGLYLAKVFAEALGGTIGVESKVGEGSTFTLQVPMGK